MIPPLEHNPRYHALDLWRGLFCLVVVLEHAGVALWPGISDASGFEQGLRLAIVTPLRWNVGTPLFFVISGYCIAASTDAHRRKGHSPLRFLARRLWRIFPSYWAALLGFAVVVTVLDLVGLERWHRSDLSLELVSLHELKPSQWLGNLTLTETWRPRVWGTEELIFTRVAWSLCYQEQFYLVCFLLLLAFPRRYFGALGMATAVIVGFRVVAWDAGALHRFDGMFPKLWHEFAVGLAVFWRLNARTTPLSRRMVDLGLVVLLGLACCFGSRSTIAAAGFGLALIAMRRWDEPIRQCTWLDPIRACGRRSYSIYLIHLPVCLLVNAVIGSLGVREFWFRLAVMIPASLAMSLLVGWAFHHWIDVKFTELPKFGSSRRGPAPLTSLNPLPRAG